MTNIGAEILAVAIVYQAYKDYVEALKILKNKKSNTTQKYCAKCTIKECERFFYGSLYSNITKIKPEVIIKKAKEEANKQKNMKNYKKI